MPPEAAIWWLRLALGDLAAARGLLMPKGVALRQAAYLAQQATEKGLKATIALEGSEPPLTHDLIFLIAKCPKEAGLHQVDIDIVALSDAQTAARCPDPEGLPYDHDESELRHRPYDHDESELRHRPDASLIASALPNSNFR